LSGVKRIGLSEFDWGELFKTKSSELSSDQKRILAMLLEKKSTPVIAKEIGRSRSAVWREVLRLKTLLAGIQRRD
jgi:IS30 family transposase